LSRMRSKTGCAVSMLLDWFIVSRLVQVDTEKPAQTRPGAAQF